MVRPPDCLGPLVRRPGGPPRQMLKEGVERRRGPRDFSHKEGGLYLDKLFAGVANFLVTPLLMGLVYLIYHGRFEEPVHLCTVQIQITDIIVST